ncbi:hypothetical protein F5148DRAFT_1161502 [Russula earlei]|uniref:Uncharacterized protein n=1 Tax=Russula earlei TaxID=71964 RepID=A0ACC0UM54_9AGAM|nr:hypothetical protein F5148DRAFT_1161502 [Russula earlei]
MRVSFIFGLIVAVAPSIALPSSFPGAPSTGFGDKEGGEDHGPNDLQLPQFGTHRNRNERTRLEIRSSFADVVAARRKEREREKAMLRNARSEAQEKEWKWLDLRSEQRTQAWKETSEQRKAAKLAKAEHADPGPSRPKRATRPKRVTRPKRAKRPKSVGGPPVMTRVKAKKQEVPGPSRPESVQLQVMKGKYFVNEDEEEWNCPS